MIKAEARVKAEETDWLEGATAADRVRWAVDRYDGQLVMSTSFGIQSAVMLHLVTRITPEIPIIFVDTGYHFTETYQFADTLRDRLGLNLKVYTPRRSGAWQEAAEGKRWEQGLDGLEAYNRENKVEPMNRALQELQASAWLSGLRRVQAQSRTDLQVVQQQKRTVKIHPIIDWNEKAVYTYLQEHDLPFHPLWEKGYVSIGDWHSTAPLEAGMATEDTRFGGLKRECGLHEASDQPDWQI